MGFFATFWAWLDTQLLTYVATQTRAVARALEPAIITFGTIYVMMWGYMHLTGRVEEPLALGLKRIILLSVVLGVSIGLWTYNDIIVATFYNGPMEFATAITGATEPIAIVDTIMGHGTDVALDLITRASFFDADTWGLAVAGIIVWILVAILCIYTIFLISLAKVAMAILLALGPFFIAMLLFESTKQFFARWMSQLVNYALVTILTIMLAVFMLQEVDVYAQRTAARVELMTVDTLDLILITGLAYLFLSQIPTLAGSLSSGGVGLATYDWMERGGRWATGQAMAAQRKARQKIKQGFKRLRDNRDRTPARGAANTVRVIQR